MSYAIKNDTKRQNIFLMKCIAARSQRGGDEDMSKKDDKKPARWTAEFTFDFVPLPEEREEGYWDAIHYFAQVMFADFLPMEEQERESITEVDE